ncbi:hypothetical protein ACFYMW_40335 [Streptomyces sp. NPDC006692]|uniref:hypothetical protein n=1 Tax=unclassified Streptomyces TaxID=2593676 RepID=UPI0036B32E7B
MAGFAFPRDLREAQLRLHQVRAEYAELCRSLPWSVVPADGWTSAHAQFSGYAKEFPATTGYTAQQVADEDRLRRELLDLSITVSTHPYWGTVEGESVVDERMALKHSPGALSTDWALRSRQPAEHDGEELAAAA